MTYGRKCISLLLTLALILGLMLCAAPPARALGSDLLYVAGVDIVAAGGHRGHEHG